MKDKTIIRITLPELAAFFFLAVMMIPVRYAYSHIETVFLVIAGVLNLPLILRNRTSALMKWIAVYVVILLSITFFNGSGDIHSIVSYAKLLLVCILVDVYMEYDRKYIVNALFVIMLIMVAIDVYSLIAFPNGLYIEDVSYNEWSTGQLRGWFLGKSNNHLYWYILLIATAFIKQEYGTKRITVIGLSAVALFAMIKLGSVDSIISVSVIILMVLFIKSLRSVRINGRIVFAALVIINVIFVFGNANAFSYLIENFIGKDSTFTNRKQLWEVAIQLFADKPITGYGLTSDSIVAEIAGSAAYVNMHNQWLQTLFEGGILLMIPFVFIMSSPFRICRKLPKGTDIIMWIGIPAVIMIHMIFECDFGSRFLIALLLSYHMGMLQRPVGEKKGGQNGTN